MPARPAVGRRAPARHADRRHAARADARHAGRQRGDLRARLVRRRDRDRPRSAPRTCSPPLTRTLARCSRSTPPPSAGSRSATSGSPGRRRAASRPRRTCSTPSRRCAACSSTRPRSSPATTCSCSSAATARSTRRCFDELAYQRARAVRVLGARGELRAQRGPADPPLRDEARPRAARGAPSRTRWWDSEARVPRAHPRAARRATGPLRARDIEDRAQVGWESHAAGRTRRNVARMLDLMWVRGHVGISRREGAQRVWDLMERCLPRDAPRRAS